MTKGKMAALSQRMAPDATPGEQLIAGGATVQQMQTEYITAVSCQVPRDLDLVEKRVLAECRWEPDGLIYSWTARNSDGSRSGIEGPSIKMAMILARNWGNSATDVQVVSETESHWILKGVFYDFELGSTTPRLFRMRKPLKGKGRFDLDRQEDIDFQIAQSKAIRNAVINAMPAGLVKIAMDAAKGNVKKEVEKEIQGGQLATAIQRVLAAFKKYEVPVEALEARIGKPKKAWGADEVTALRAIGTSIRDGVTTAEEEFDLAAGAKAAMEKEVSKPKPKPKAPSKSKQSAPEEPPPADEPPPDFA